MSHLLGLLAHCELVDTSRWHKALSALRPAQDLEQDRHVGRHEGGVIDEKGRAIEVEDHVDGLVDPARLFSARLCHKQQQVTVSI